jgi:hypothetical protein
MLLLVAWFVTLDTLGTLGTITLRINAGTVLLGIAPTVAIVVNYYLAKRQRNVIAAESTEKVAEVHTLVNSQKDHLEAKISEQARRIDEQDASISELTTQLRRAGSSA